MTRRLPLLLLLAAAGCATATARPPRHDGIFQGRTVFGIDWRVELVKRDQLFDWKPQEFASPVSNGRSIYVGTSAGMFFCLDAHRGQVRWRFKTNGVIDARPLYVEARNAVFFGGGDSHLYALDAETGKLLWKQRTRGLVRLAPVYADGRLHVVTDEDRLFAVDAATGKWLWQYEREVPEAFTIHGQAGPTIHGGKVYAGFADGYLVALNQKTGEVVWSRSLAAAADQYVDVDTTPVIHRDVLYAASHTGGLYAMSPKDGTVHWRFDVVGAGTVRVTGDRIYFTAPQAGLHVLDLKGRLLWRQGIGKGGQLTSPLLVAQYLVFAGADAGLYVVDRESGTLLQFFSPGPGISGEPTLHGRDLLVLSNGGYLYRMRLR
jgi:outer membrane protein assembly factor BamB